MSAFEWDDSAVDQDALDAACKALTNRTLDDIAAQLALLYQRNRSLRMKIEDAEMDARQAKAHAESCQHQLLEFRRKKSASKPIGTLEIQGQKAVVHIDPFGDGALWPNGFCSGDRVRIKLA